MAEKITKCPMCNTKLKIIDGKMACKFCGYYLRDQSFTTEKPSGNASTQVAVVGLIIAIVTVIGITAGALFHHDNDPDSHSGKENSASNSSHRVSWQDREIASHSTPAPDAEPAEQQPAVQHRLPQSGFFQELAEVIWNKNFSDISADEYSSLVSLEIDQKNKYIYYTLSDGSSDILTFANADGMDLADLACFTNMEFIYIPDYSLSKGDLDGLYNLYGVVADNTIEDYLSIIPSPDSIYVLSIADEYYKSSLSGIESFSNLEYLMVDYVSLADISALTQLPYLYGLELENCNSLRDFSPLSSLTGMESLSITSSQLDSIDFIENMPNLTSLTVKESSIESIDSLIYCPNLTNLSLVENINVTDYSVVGELTQLVDLDLTYYWFGGDLPSFEKLTSLESLTTSFANDLTPLKDAVSLTYLSLNLCSGLELETLTALQNLESLEIHKFSSTPESLEPLTRIPNLQYLDLSKSWVYSNIEEIFSIPTLLYLDLDDCYVGIDFDNITVNPSLETLYMDRLTIWDDPTYYDQTETELRDHVDMFALFPNLTELYAASMGLDDISFVEDLPYLQYLDITDNLVTSLKPLETLDYFVTVWCGKNDILENVSQDSGIQVITDGYNYN